MGKPITHQSGEHTGEPGEYRIHVRTKNEATGEIFSVDYSNAKIDTTGECPTCHLPMVLIASQALAPVSYWRFWEHRVFSLYVCWECQSYETKLTKRP